MKRKYDLSHFVKPLTDAATVAPSSDSTGFDLSLLIHNLEQEADKQEHPIARLISLIKNEPCLEQFEGWYVTIEQATVLVQYSKLTEWLISRACKVGAERALNDLIRYMEADSIPVHRAVAVGGIEVVGQHDLVDGLKLIPFDEFPECDDKKYLTERFLYRMKKPSAILLKCAEIKKLQVHADELVNQQQNSSHRADYQNIDDAILCLGLFGPTAPHPLAKWTLLPDWAFAPFHGYSMPYEGEFFLPRQMPTDAPVLTARLLTSWNSLENKHRAKLRLAMERLNSAMRSASLVDSAIDLGIVLESLFLDDDNSELSFRLTVRAARWLGQDLAERKKLSTSLKDLYTCRSKAVHTGTVPDEMRKRPTCELIEEGYKHAATAIKRMIVEGKPSWDDIMYS